MKIYAIAIALATGAAMLAGAAAANTGRDAILSDLLAKARQKDPSFGGFSAKRGGAFFHAHHSGGKPQTPSCSTCHTKSPRNTGHTRAGKAIHPMAVSLSPKRFTDPAKVAKWFGRNCRTVLGRECTAAEKGDFITYMMSQ